jgi:hypothetical protein
MKDGKLKEIESLADIPEGMTEAEEHEFWSSHSLGEGIELYLVPEDDPDLPPARVVIHPNDIRLRFEDDVHEKLIALAKREGVSLRRLIKSIVLERLAKEHEVA